MTIRKKIFTAGIVIFFIFVVLALMNIRTHQQVLANLEIRDKVNNRLAGIKEFAMWKSELVRSVSDIVASGHVPPFMREPFSPPSQGPSKEGALLVKTGKRLIDLVGKKERIAGDVEETYRVFRTKINDLYYRLDEKIATVLAVAQMDKVMGKDSLEIISLAPYVLKNLNQLTLVALNNLISRTETEADRSTLIKHRQFLSSQLETIDDDGRIAALFEEMFEQITSLHTFIQGSNDKLSDIEIEIANAKEAFDLAVGTTAIDTIVAKAQSEVTQANDMLEKASRHTVTTVVIFLFAVPIVVVAVGMFGLNTVIIRPITHLVDAMKNVKDGDFDVTVPVASHDEIGTLSKAFEAMATEIHTKVTEMSRLNQTLEESESKYRNLVANLPQRIFVKDKNSVFVSCNQNFAQDLGISEEDIAGKTDFDFFPKELAEKYRKDDARIFLTKATEEIEEFYIQKGERRHVQTVKTPIRDDTGEVSGVLGIFWDITKRKQAEEALQESRERLKNIFDSVQAGIVIIDEGNHTIVDANLAAVNMIGISKEKLIGHTCHKYICPAEEGQCPVTDTDADKDTSERVVVTSEGKHLPVMKTVMPIVLDGRRHLLESFIDITKLKEAEQEKKQLESQLRQAMKMEAIGTLAGGIAHDFNNILGAIMGYGELALLDAPTGSQLKDNLGEVLKATKRAKDLVQQILTFSHQSEKKFKPVQLRLITKEALKLLRASIPTTIAIHEEIESDGLALADPSQIHQVLMNLCTNAWHAMEQKGGVLQVGLKDTFLDADMVSPYPGMQAGPYIQLTVNDTGHGIPADVLDRIFDPFFSTKETGKGTGLGLSVVHGIVKNHGGRIDVESTPGQGTRITVYIPAIERPSGSEEKPEPTLPMGTEHVLFIDDEESLVNMGRQMLTYLGYKVTTRLNSLEALELFKAHPERFDVVITDQTMPGMTGHELAEEFISIRPDIPIILCTGFSWSITEKQAYDMGIQAYIMKPLIIQKLADTIRKVLNKNRQG